MTKSVFFRRTFTSYLKMAAIAALRERLSAKGADYFVLQTADAHNSEYVSTCDRKVEFFSGFSGSLAYLLVPTDPAKKALLWTDSRYWLQADTELDGALFSLMKLGEKDVPVLSKYLQTEVPDGSTIAVDARMFPASFFTKLASKFKKMRKSFSFVDESFYIEGIWTERPPRPTEPIQVVDEKYTGQSAGDKLEKLVKEMQKAKVDFLILSNLDEIAYVLNMRGKDISYNPLFFSYMIVGLTSHRLYLDHTLTPTQQSYLGALSVTIKPYSAFFGDLEGLEQVWIDTSTASYEIYRLTGAKSVVKSDSTPVVMMKAVKNPTEVKGFYECHKRDGVALVRYLHWLAMLQKPSDYDEVTSADILADFRSELADFQGLSFNTISSVGSNAAIVHYSPIRGQCRALEHDMYLVDSGGQYLDGTTDVTRTVHLGTPSEAQKDCFTRVLMGFIDLSLVTFPKGVSGGELDVLARAHLWKVGLTYGHGTGHGIGHFLCVHEGPHGISVRPSSLATPLTPGMIVTDEPGYYQAGAFGIRIENALVVVEAPISTPTKPFYTFDHLTLAPIERKLINQALLLPHHIQWLNTYHQRVLTTLTPHLPKDCAAWLTKACAPL